MDTDQPHGQGTDELSTLTEIIESLLAELHSGEAVPPRVQLDSSLDRDLGLDSLTRLELFARIEQRFAQALPDRVSDVSQRFQGILLPRRKRRAISSALWAAVVPSPPQSSQSISHHAKLRT